MTVTSAFAHNRDVTSGNDLVIGQAVSFIIEDGPKGPSAKNIKEDGGGELVLKDESTRLYGKIKVFLLVLQLFILVD